MGWREKIEPASFRGVPFQVQKDSQPAGPRTQLHEYPQRDKPLVESLGRRTIEIKLKAFVAGDDCLEQRDKLLEAIEEPGSGELVHPWKGRMTVSVTDCVYRHDRAQMGVVWFDLTFVEGEAEPSYPVAGQSAATVLNAAADGLEVSALDRFAASLSQIDLSQLRIDAVLQPISQVVGVVQDVYGNVSSVMTTAQGLVQAIIAGPEQFARTLMSAIGSVQTTFTGFYQRAQGVVSLFGLGDRLSALPRLNAVIVPSGSTAGMFVAATRSLVQDAVAVDVLRGVAKLPAKGALRAPAGVQAIDADSVRSHAISLGDSDQVVRVALGRTGIEPPVADDVLAVRDALLANLWTLAESAPATHYQSLAGARVLAARHLLAVSKQGARLVRVQTNMPTPALVLAYSRYADATRAGELVTRNVIRHPGFVPAAELLVPKD